MRYSKQERFKPMENSSEVLKTKKVAVVGLGGLGSHSSEYLVRMGVGNIVLIDVDFVEESNLSRQGLYGDFDAKASTFKVDAAKKSLSKINTEIHITTFDEMLNGENANVLLDGVDLVIDGTDNMTARYVINDYCFQNNIPWVYAAATASTGVVSNFIPGKTPCLRCIYGEPKEDGVSCDANGIILPALTMITSLQVTEAIKILLDKEPILGEFRFDIWNRRETLFDTSMLNDPECECKRKKESNSTENRMYMICNGDSIQVHTSYNPEKLEEKFNKKGFEIKKKNDLFIEMVKEGKRIVVYKTGKIVFYDISKNEIEKMLSGDINKVRTWTRKLRQGK